LESRRVRTHPFISTCFMGWSDFKSLNIFVRCMKTPYSWFARSRFAGLSVK
jgi:hypothetical protein